jgi:hypothetical protein
MSLFKKFIAALPITALIGGVLVLVKLMSGRRRRPDHQGGRGAPANAPSRKALKVGSLNHEIDRDSSSVMGRGLERSCSVWQLGNPVFPGSAPGIRRTSCVSLIASQRLGCPGRLGGAGCRM